ncbi:MAG TPA: universal stress protein [Methylomirabilota bacterium]|nr:universal stress protein [Methylomirabilota bacterium]
MRLNEILFPTDFSPASEAAGRIARQMAVQSGARLHVLHVVPPVTDPSLPAEHLAQAARSLADGLRVETTLLSGWAARNIVDYAREKRIDLIVVGTHGRTGITHALLGSVAETVVRLAPCLVLTVPASMLAERSAASPATPAAAVVPRPCLVCGQASQDLICEGCRARIRGEALEEEREVERPGRRGLPV